VPRPLLIRADDQCGCLVGGAGEVGGDDVGGVPIEGDPSPPGLRARPRTTG